MAVSEYSGRPEKLDEYFAGVICKDGNIAVGGVQVLEAWLRRLEMPLSIKVSTTPADTCVAGNPGVLCRTGRNSYEICAWRAKAEEPTNTSAKAGYEVFLKVYAYEIAARRYMPSVKLFVNGWEPNVPVLVQAVSIDGESLMFPEVKADSFVKKVYPSVVFQELEDNLSVIEELTLAAVTSVLKKDTVEAARVKDAIDAKVREAKTESVRRIYETLTQQIEKELAAATKDK